MLKTLAPWFLSLFLLVFIAAADNGYVRCACDDEGSLWSMESILECQRVSDFLIAVAYFSIPIELIYFVSCSNFPFKWVLFQFIAFIVLCGMTHLINSWTYGPHTFQIMVALTIFKILTALVSCATAITLITLFPLLLKVKVREFMLKKKAWDLGREVGMMMKQKETTAYVRMLTQEIRKSLDRHTILHTTLVELSRVLNLQNCAVWMPNQTKTEMILTHDLKGRNSSGLCDFSVPINDPDVAMIKGSEDVIILSPDSQLSFASSVEPGEHKAIAAIRMPMLRFANFKGGTPELILACYAILVLVLPSGHWSSQEVEIVKVVADQVAVALSHAAVLEESQHMREQLEDQNRALQQAQRNAMMASQARNSFQKVMSNGMRKPMHSITALLSMLQDEKMSSDQQLIVDTMVKTSNVLSTLINDVMDNPVKNNGIFQLEMRSFQFHCMIKEAASLAKCLCISRGFGFSIEVEKSLPNNVIGDERRVFQVILHMVGSLLNDSNQGGTMIMKIFSNSESKELTDQKWPTWRPSSSSGDVSIKFEVGINRATNSLETSILAARHGDKKYTSEGAEKGLSFSVCKRLVQLMQGNIWVVPNSQSYAQRMYFVLRFQLRPSMSGSGEISDHSHLNSICRGLQVLLAEDDGVNRAVTRKMLEKLGCDVIAVSSGLECLNVISPAISPVQVVLLDLQMPELNGFEVAVRIRKYRSRNWPIIIALATSAGEDVWDKCQQTGINGVICKPVMLRGLADELRMVLVQAGKHI